MKYKVLTFSIDPTDGNQTMEDRKAMEDELNKWAEDGWQVCKMSTTSTYCSRYDFDENDNEHYTGESYCGYDVIVVMEKE